MKKSFNLNESGFTLIELMITIAVLALAIVGLLGTNTSIQRSSEAAFERTVAIQDANQVIERMRNAANAASSNYQSAVQTAATAAVASVGSLPSSHSETITVAYVDTTADPLDVTVTVAWNELGVRAVTKSIRTLITRRGT